MAVRWTPPFSDFCWLRHLAVLIRRGKQTRALLISSWPILLYFVYCLISVVWSYHPDVSLKRWIKSIGDLAMALVVATEPRLSDALGRLYSRVGFLVFPVSVLLIKYYGELGRGYSPDGEPMNIGVTTNKNLLGVIVLVVSLGVVWRVISLLRDKTEPNRRRHLIAQGVLLAFCIALGDGSFCHVAGVFPVGHHSDRYGKPAHGQKAACLVTCALSCSCPGRGIHFVFRRRGRRSKCIGQVESVGANRDLGCGDSCGPQRDGRRWIREFLDHSLLHARGSAPSSRLVAP